LMSHSLDRITPLPRILSAAHCQWRSHWEFWTCWHVYRH